MINNEIDIILSHYFGGEATKKELRTLDYWLAESDENEKYFQQMNLLYRYAGQIEPLQDIDTEKAWSKFKTYILEKQKSGFFIKRSYIFRAAAVVALLLMSSFALFYFSHQPSETIQLTAVETHNEFNMLENVNVTLFSESEIIYNKKRNNAVKLKGKAVFHVSSKDNTLAKNTKRLIVQAGETYIEDFGTIFTVDALNPDKFITVKVDEGAVRFYTKSDTGIYLKANETATYDVQAKQFTKIVADIIFQNTPLQDAINIIKVRYNVNILINSKALNEIPLNASFDKNESVENILDIIAETISARLSKKGDVYIITQKQ
jgi:ferric-dicitrate binding protein FerR (iron transport regulator)